MLASKKYSDKFVLSCSNHTKVGQVINCSYLKGLWCLKAYSVGHVLTSSTSLLWHFENFDSSSHHLCVDLTEWKERLGFLMPGWIFSFG